MIKFSDKYGNVEIRALSWKQPFCSLMACGKENESRVWGTDYRGWVLLCASKAPYKKEVVYSICKDYDQYMTIVNALKNHKQAAINGKALYVGQLINCWQMKPQGEAKAFVGYSADLFIHQYDNVQAIEPFDWKGSLGWKKLDSETIDKIILI